MWLRVRVRVRYRVRVRVRVRARLEIEQCFGLVLEAILTLVSVDVPSVAVISRMPPNVVSRTS